MKEKNEEEEALEPIKERINYIEVETLRQKTAIADTKAKSIRKEVKIRETVQEVKGKRAQG